MGLHRVIRRYQNRGGQAALKYLWRLQKNNLVRAANLLGPSRKRCPCCGWTGMRFLDYAGHRQNAIICPRCGSHPRHRMLWMFLAARIDRLEAGSAVLHLSAEQNMRPLFTRRPDLRYITTDLKLKDSTVLADATRMPFQSDTFQLIVSSHVLEHIERDREAIAEFSRILAPGGEAILMVPTVPDWRTGPTREFGAADPELQGHWRIYGFDLANRLDEAGLRSAIASTSESLPEDTIAECELMDDAIFIGQKPRS